MDQLNDLVYTDSTLFEQGVIQSYDLDFDTADTKDFELVTNDLTMRIGSFFFIDGTEIGGIVDSFKTSTSSDTITYKGRNFRGILASHIIPNGIVSEGEDIVSEINLRLLEAGLNRLYVCDYPLDETESLNISNYEYDTNCTLYDGITNLASSINFNLTYTFKMSDHKVHIVPVFANDFSDYITYCRDNSLGFEISINSGSPNHLIVRGEDEEGYLLLIHLYTDDNYGLKSYALNSTATYSLRNGEWDGDFTEPLQDSDYILDNSQQELFGIHEIAEVVDCSVQKVDNYILTTERPSAWSKDYIYYYVKEVNEDGYASYSQVQPIENATYTLQTSAPSDWQTSYDSYYRHTGTGSTDDDYSHVQTGSSVSGYTELTKKPADWVSTYNLYYTREWNGDEYVYSSVSGVNKYTYALQTRKPDSWNENYNRYWTKRKVNNRSYWVRPTSSNNKAPVWAKNKYYTAKQKTVAPPWPGTVYIQHTTETVPTWASGTFYTRSAKYSAPAWKQETYFERVEDHYASLVSSGINHLMNSIVADQQSVTLDDFEVTIGDTVGGIDEKTGIAINESVTNIVLKYSNGILSSIDYVIGGQY